MGGGRVAAERRGGGVVAPAEAMPPSAIARRTAATTQNAAAATPRAQARAVTEIVEGGLGIEAGRSRRVAATRSPLTAGSRVPRWDRHPKPRRDTCRPAS